MGLTHRPHHDREGPNQPHDGGYGCDYSIDVIEVDHFSLSFD
jgi:hypothetical protein